MKPFYEFSQLSLLNYRENPRAKTRSELVLLRKQENLSKSAVFSEKIHTSQSKRVEYREKKFINHSFTSENPYKTLKKQQKTQDLLNFEQKFPLKACGIHSDTLPKFFDIREKFFQNILIEQNNETEDFMPKKLNISKNSKKNTEIDTIINKYNHSDIVELKELIRNANFMVENYKKSKTSNDYLKKKPKNIVKMQENKDVTKQKTIQDIMRQKTIQGLIRQKTVKNAFNPSTMNQSLLVQSKTASNLEFLLKKEVRTTGFIKNLA